MNTLQTSSPNSPTLVLDDLPLHWQMTRNEKFAFYSLCQQIRPEIAIEVGTYRGGSLQVLSQFAKTVYSVDISDEPAKTLSSRFSNVQFLSGDSKKLLPELLSKLQSEKAKLEFILIDGDHTYEGLKNDIASLLTYTPTVPVTIIFHDSFHPACRRAITESPWNSNPHVHLVETDFITGVYHEKAFDTASARSMWGGFAVARMMPEKRTHQLTIHQSQQGIFNAVYQKSCYRSWFG